MPGHLCTVGELPNIRRVFYYATDNGLHIELIDRRNKDLKHLVQLVDEEGQAVPIPKGASFVHISSEIGTNLLDQHLRRIART